MTRILQLSSTHSSYAKVFPAHFHIILEDRLERLAKSTKLNAIMAPRAKLQENFDVDYVITYRFTDTSEILWTSFGGLC